MDMGCYLIHFATMAMDDVEAYKTFLGSYTSGAAAATSDIPANSGGDDSVSGDDGPPFLSSSEALRGSAIESVIDMDRDADGGAILMHRATESGKTPPLKDDEKRHDTSTTQILHDTYSTQDTHMLRTGKGDDAAPTPDPPPPPTPFSGTSRARRGVPRVPDRILADGWMDGKGVDIEMSFVLSVRGGRYGR